MQYQSIDNDGGSETQEAMSSEKVSASQSQGLYRPGDTVRARQAAVQGIYPRKIKWHIPAARRMSVRSHSKV